MAKRQAPLAREVPPAEPTPVSAPSPSVFSDPLAAPVPQPAPNPLVRVGVRNRCPWNAIQSASSMWTKAPTLIHANDPRLPELRRCEWLLVEDVEA